VTMATCSVSSVLVESVLGVSVMPVSLDIEEFEVKLFDY
jgi:hypothetical protein